MKDVVWKQSPSFDKYEAGDNGKIRNKRTKKERSLFVNHAGYYKLNICVGSDLQKKTVFAHAIIADAFLGKKPIGMTVDHIDNNKKNNRPDNLEYVSFNENMARRNNKKTEDVGAYYCKYAKRWRAKKHRKYIGNYRIAMLTGFSTVLLLAMSS